LYDEQKGAVIMILNGFDQSGTLPVTNSRLAMDYYKTIFDMEEVYHHMDMKLKINGKFFFEIREVSQEQHEAYMKAISKREPILGTMVQYDTEDALRKAHNLLSAEALHAEEIAPLPWCPCSATVIDKYGIQWWLSTPMHMPCSDCKKPDCEGDWDSRCRLPKWTVELYKRHGADWYKHIPVEG